MQFSYKFTFIGLGITALLAMGASCGTTIIPANENTPAKLQVTASFYPMAYFAEQIGGEYAVVTNLTPVGIEPHDYELTPQDLTKIHDSELIILNGIQLEPWAADITTDISSDTIVVEAADGLTDQIDPHVWLSPKLARTEVERIVEGFTLADPTHAASYTANGEALLTRLQELDMEYTNGLANCGTTTFITSHAAFSYLASSYGLTQLSIAGLTPDAEPSLADLAELADFARAHNVQYIFFEELVSPKLSETIADEIGAATLVLNPLEGLSEADLAAGQDYVTVMESNLANLRTALQCQ